MGEVTELLARLEAATADQQHGLLLEAFIAMLPRHPIGKAQERFIAMLDAGAYESAALTLVPEGWRPYTADMSVRGRTRWMLEGPKTKWVVDEDGDRRAGDDWYSQGVAPTPALAIVIAAIRAKGDA